MESIKTVADVAAWRLCVGCGACSSVCPEKKVKLFDFHKEGIRPVVVSDDCGGCSQCIQVCPTVQSDFHPTGQRRDPIRSDAVFEKEWGRIEGIWEGYASDPTTRFRGSSGGVLTAISTYCLEVENMRGVLHTGQDPEDATRNRTRVSRNREDLLRAAGSRYSPASVCNGLGLIESMDGPFVIIGKPAEISAVANARRMRPELDRRVGLTISFFCAETPSTEGTLALLRKMGMDPNRVTDLRYRGDGWPGHFAPTADGEANPRHKMTYRESWAYLQAFRPWSVHLWPDSTGELADITCGDPWYEEPDGKNPGFSLVVARTLRGREIVEGAIEAGYLTLKPAEEWKLVKSQSGLLAKKRTIWGRQLAMRIAGVPVTRHLGLPLRECWSGLSGREKIRVVMGTLRRIFTRGLWKKLELDPTGEKEIVAPGS